MTGQQFGKWKVEGMLDPGRCFLAVSDDGTKGAVKIGHRIRNEVSVLTELGSHPNIVKLIDYNLDADIPFMVTELCEGFDLDRNVLEQWDLDERIDCFIQLLKGHLYCRDKGIAPIAVEYFLKRDKTPVIGDFEAARKGGHPAPLRVPRLFERIVLLDKIDGEILKDWGFSQRRNLIDRVMSSIGYPPAFIGMTRFFWELMEGKSYQEEMNKRSNRQKRLKEIDQRIEQLKEQKKDLLSIS